MTLRTGGHSLKATMLISRIHTQFGIEVPLREVFRYPTVREMAGILSGMEHTVYEAIVPAGQRAFYPASSAQKRLYVISQFEGAEVSYNIPQMLEVKGPLDHQRLERALQQLVKRHESLRTSFEMVEGELVQRVHDSGELSSRLGLNRIAVNGEEAEVRVREFIQPSS